jgi:hypothetical protein
VVLPMFLLCFGFLILVIGHFRILLFGNGIPSLWGRVVRQPMNSSLKGVVWFYCLGSVPHFHTVRCRISSITHFRRVVCSVTRGPMIRVR